MPRDSSSRRKILSILLFILLSIPFLPGNYAVSSPYQIYGFVTDSTGNPAYSVEINVTDLSSGRYTVVFTDRDGQYSVDLSDLGDYADGDVINVTARTVRTFLGISYTICGNGEGYVDIADSGTRIDISMNRSLAVLSGSVADFLGTPLDSVSIDMKDLNTGETFRADMDSLSGSYAIPLCVLPSLSAGDQLFMAVSESTFYCEESFLFSGGLSLVQNLTLYDITPPKVHFLYPADGSILSMSSELVFYTQASDDDMVSSVSLYYSDGGYFSALPMTCEVNDSTDWDGSGTLDSDIFGVSLGIPGVPENISFYVSVEDRAGNTACYPENYTTEPRTISLVDTIPPSIALSAIASMEAGISTDVYSSVADDWQVSAVYLDYIDVSGFDHNTTMESCGNGSFRGEISGQSTGQVRYSVVAFDGRNWNSTPPFTVPVVDTTPPEIEHEPLNSMNAGSSSAIIALITDVSGVHNATLHYQGVGDTTFSSVLMSEDGDNFTAVIPAQSETGEVRYFITCDDGLNSARLPESGDIVVPVYDAGTPVIESVSCGPADVGSQIPVTAEISDDIGISSATLYYNLSGSSSMSSIPMSVVSGDSASGVWTALIPAMDMPLVLWYRIEATDGTNNITYPYLSMEPLRVEDLSPPVEISADIPSAVNISGPATFSITASDNYRIVSVRLMEVADNGTWFISHSLSLSSGGARNGTWNTSLSFGRTGDLRLFFEVSDGVHITRYPRSGFVNVSLIDDIPPEISDVQARPLSHPLPAVPGDSVVVEAYVTDNLLVESASLTYSSPGEMVRTVSMVYEGSHIFSAVSLPSSSPGDFRYFVTVSDGFSTVRFPQDGWLSISIVDRSPPMIIHNIPLRVEAGRSPFIYGSVTDDFNLSFLTAHYRFVSDSGIVTSWRDVPVVMDGSVVSDSGVSRSFSLRLPSFFDTGIIEFNMSASDGFNTIYSPADSSLSIGVVDTTPPSVEVLPPAPVCAGNESLIYVRASDITGVSSVSLRTSDGRVYTGEYTGSDSSGNGTYVFRLTADSDLLYTVTAVDGRYNTGEYPDSGYYLLRVSHGYSPPPVDVSEEPFLVLNAFSGMLIIIQAAAIFLLIIYRKLI